MTHNTEPRQRIRGADSFSGISSHNSKPTNQDAESDHGAEQCNVGDCNTLKQHNVHMLIRRCQLVRFIFVDCYHCYHCFLCFHCCAATTATAATITTISNINITVSIILTTTINILMTIIINIIIIIVVVIITLVTITIAVISAVLFTPLSPSTLLF